MLTLPGAESSHASRKYQRGIEMNVIQPALFSVIAKFPAFREEVTRSFKRSEAFKEVCMDYQECINAIHNWSRSMDEEAWKRKTEYEKLLAELEEEIAQSPGQNRLDTDILP
jgi:hypothetical protein